MARSPGWVRRVSAAKAEETRPPTRRRGPFVGIAIGLLLALPLWLGIALLIFLLVRLLG